MKDSSESDRNYGRAHGRAVTRNPSQDYSSGLSNPPSDVLEGPKTKALPSHLHDYSLHTKVSLSFSHFAAEFKRTDGNPHQAICQAAYDGAVLVNTWDRPLARTRANVLDGAATAALNRAAAETAVFTCTTDGKAAEVYSHHAQNGQYH